MTHREVIDNWCHDHNSSYVGLSRRCGLHEWVIEQIVRGVKRLRPEVAIAIERVTGLNAEDLLFRQVKLDLQQARAKQLEPVN